MLPLKTGLALNWSLYEEVISSALVCNTKYEEISVLTMGRWILQRVQLLSSVIKV